MEEILVIHSNLLESFYCNKDVIPLTSGKVCKICVIKMLYVDQLWQMFTDIKFSPKGSSGRDKEEATYMFFLNYLEDCEKEINSKTLLDACCSYSAGQDPYCVSLPTILSFFTGSNSVLPLENNSGTLNFNHDNPTAFICAQELTLPMMHKKYSIFKKHLHVALTMHGGIGLV